METGVDLQALEAWMDQRKLGFGELQSVERVVGGTQNILLSFQRAGREYILRRPPAVLQRNSNETMRREARILMALAGTQVPHPKLIAACSDENVLGAAFYLMEPVKGFCAAYGMPNRFASSPEMRHQMGLSLVDGLTALGRLDYIALGLSDLGQDGNYLVREVSRCKARLASYGDVPEWDGLADLDGVERIGQWLEANRPIGYQPGLIHGDYHLGNVMFAMEAPRLAAIIGWERAAIGDPLLDLGWLLATWPDSAEDFGIGSVGATPWDGFPKAGELVARYGASSSRDVSAIEWYGVLACYKLAIIQEGTYVRACAGKTTMSVGEYLHQRAIWLLRRALQWIS